MAELEAPAITGTITSSLVLAADDPSARAVLWRSAGRCAAAGPQQHPLAGSVARRWLVGVVRSIQTPPQPRQQGRLALCLQRKVESTGALAVRHAWIEETQELGASVDDPPRHEPLGAGAWRLDPEGNRLLLLVLPAS